MKRIWVLFIATFAIVLAGWGQVQTTNAGPKFFLFVVNTGKAMGPRESATALTVTYIVEHAANGNMERGDLFNIWTYGDTIRTNTFQPQVWTPEIRRQVANVAFYHLIKQKWTGKSETGKAMQLIKAEIAARQNLFIYLISSGTDTLNGTPFDVEINDACRQNAQTWRDLNAVSVIALVAEKGQIVDWAVGMSLPPDYVKPIARKPFPPPAPAPKTNAPPKQVTTPKPKIAPKPFIMRPSPEPEKPAEKPVAPVESKPVLITPKPVIEPVSAPKLLPMVQADKPVVAPVAPPPARLEIKPAEVKPRVTNSPLPLVAAPKEIAISQVVKQIESPPIVPKPERLNPSTPPPPQQSIATVVAAPQLTATQGADKKLAVASKPKELSPVLPVIAQVDTKGSSAAPPPLIAATVKTNTPMVAHATPVENLSAFVKLSTAVILIALAVIIAMLWRRGHQPAPQSIISQSLSKQPEARNK